MSNHSQSGQGLVGHRTRIVRDLCLSEQHPRMTEPGSSTIDRMSVVDLEAKAVRQWEAIEQRRLAVVARTFSASAE